MSDEKLKQALAKMLPGKLTFCSNENAGFDGLFWSAQDSCDPAITLDHYVIDTELLHLCALVEESLEDEQYRSYQALLSDLKAEAWYNNKGGKMFKHESLSATWQQRVTALAKVKGIEL